MNTEKEILNSKQLVFKELFLGTLVYAIVLGFFNDYTSIVYAKSFSTIFLSGFILAILTFYMFRLKKRVLSGFKKRQSRFNTVSLLFSIWLIMFLSKFVFIWVIDVIFGNNMNINGFFGISSLVACVTLCQKLTDYTFTKLGDKR